MIEYLTDFPLVTGIITAMIHVLSGPDHLAAVGSFALNTKRKSWQIGLCWGIGHTLGLLIIGTLFFFFREMIPIEFISAQSEKLVGIILIAIGIWFCYKIIKKKKTTDAHAHIHMHTNSKGKPYAHFHPHKHDGQTKHNHTHNQSKSIFASLGIGTIHGFAGVSHLLSLLPTLAFKEHTSSILYLIGFALGTILSMLLFSLILGIIGKTASKNNKPLPYLIINYVAALSAIFIGFYWFFQTW